MSSADRWKVASSPAEAAKIAAAPFQKMSQTWRTGHNWLNEADAPNFGGQTDLGPTSWIGLALFKKALEGGEPVRLASWDGNLGVPAEGLLKAIEEALNVRMVMVRGGLNGNGSFTYSSEETMLSVSFHEAGQYLSVSMATCSVEMAQKAEQLFGRVIVPDNPEAGLIFSLAKGQMGGYSIRRLGAAGTTLERGNYNPKILADYDHVVADLASPSPCGRLTILSGSPGTGKCVAKGTKVMNPSTGQLLPIEVIVQQKSKVVTFDFEKGVLFTTPSAWINTGVKKCLRVETKAGHVLEATPEHPLLTPDGWKRLDEIQPGTYIAAASSIPFPEERATISDDDVILLAALLAEGNYTHNHVGFTNADPEIVTRVTQALTPMGATLRQYPYQKNFEWRVISPKTEDNGRLSVIRRFLDKHGMGHKKAPEKVVPDVVFRLGPDQLAMFLGMLWSCDGSIEKKQGDITLGMSSKVLIEQVQHLLLRLGIKTTVKSKVAKYKGQEFHSWRLRVISTSRETFVRTIPLYGPKVERAQALKFFNNPNDDLIPLTEDLREMLRKALDEYQDRGGELKAIGVRLGRAGKFPAEQVFRREHISRTMLAAVLDVTGAKGFDWLLKPRWERVITVEGVGEREVYDLTVPETHNFLANDLVAHNTYLVRSLLSQVKTAAFVVVPPQLVPELGSPEILPALTTAKSEFNGPICLILEDADKLLVNRNAGDMSAISSMLNLGDGILGSVLDIRILATTNAEKLDMDPATRRAGRLCRYVQVNPLEPRLAAGVYERLVKKPFSFQSPISLAEVYARAREAGWVAPPIANPRPQMAKHIF